MKREVLSRAVVLGYAAGIRSMTPVAALSWGTRLGDLAVGNGPLRFLNDDRVSVGLSALAAGEMVGDKLPVIPARTEPLPLAFRLLSGGIAGATICVSENEAILPGVAVGAGAAAMGTFAGYGLRMLLEKQGGMPGWLAGMIGDIQAVALSMAGVTGDMGIGIS